MNLQVFNLWAENFRDNYKSFQLFSVEYTYQMLSITFFNFEIQFDW